MESPSQHHRDEFKGLNLQPRYINLIAGPCVQKERGTLSQLLCQRVLFCHYTPTEMKPREVKWPVKVTQDEPASILSWPQPSQCTWGRSLSSTLHSFFLKLASTPFWPPEELFLGCNLVTQKLRFPFLIFFLSLPRPTCNWGTTDNVFAGWSREWLTAPRVESLHMRRFPSHQSIRMRGRGDKIIRRPLN